MKGYKVYSEIQQLKVLGFKRDAVAKQLKVNWRTVDRYWDMPLEEFEVSLREVRRSVELDEHQAIILKWLSEYPSMTAAQVSDWLKEHYALDVKDRTVSRFVKKTYGRITVSRKLSKYVNLRPLLSFHLATNYKPTSVRSGCGRWRAHG